MKPARCLAVMYHYVRRRHGTPDAAIRGLDPDRFIEQIDALCRCMEPIDWPTFDAWKSRRAVVPERCFLLTFDDALRDHAEIVAPILESRGLRGVFFVSAGPLARRRFASAHLVHLLLARLGSDAFDAAVRRWLRVNAPAVPSCDTGDECDARRVYHYEEPQLAALKFLLAHRLPRDLRCRMLDDLRQRHLPHEQDAARRWYMDLFQLEDLQAAGHTIGGHGYEHEMYSTMSPDQRKKDVQRTRRFLNEALGERRRPFSYPFGDADGQVVEMIRAAGFVHGFTTQPQWIRRGTGDYALGRCDTIHVDRFLHEAAPCLAR